MKHVKYAVLAALLFQLFSPMTAWAATQFSMIYWASGLVSGQVYSDSPFRIYLNGNYDITDGLEMDTVSTVADTVYGNQQTSKYKYYTEFSGEMEEEWNVKSVTVYDSVYHSVNFRVTRGLDDVSRISDLGAYQVFDGIQPSTPANLSAEDITGSTISLNWTPSTDNIAVRGYEIYVNEELYDLVDANITDESESYTIEDLDSMEEYEIYVRAVDFNYNRSEFSEPITVTTIDDIAPTIPDELLLVKKTNSKITFSFTASEDNVVVGGYEVFLNNQYYDELYPSGNDTEVFTVSNLLSYKLYQITVRAFDESGNYSEFTDPLKVRTTDIVAPSAPTNLKISNVTYNSFQLNWTCAKDNIAVQTYNIENNMKVLNSVSGKTCSAIVNNAKPGTTYKFTLRAKDASANLSARSKPLSFTYNPVLRVQLSKIYFNNVVVKTGENKAQKLANNDYLVPAKPTLQALGFSIEYNSKKKIIIATKSGGAKLELSTLKANLGTVTVNGKKVKLAKPMVIKNGEILISMNFLKKTLGLK